MDKRYLLIIVIILFSCINLYFISQTSDVVGSASVDVRNFTFSLPEGMNVLNTYGDHVELNSKTKGFYATIHVLKGNSYNFTQIIGSIQNKSENTILSNGTLDVNGVRVATVYYQSKSNGFVNNRSLSYFIKDNTKFNIALSTFDYDNDRNMTIEFITYVVDTLRINHKL